MPISCPLPNHSDDCVTMAHGGGGRAAWRLLEEVILPTLGEASDQDRHDGAVLVANTNRLAFATDAHVVSPLMFPGGSIGKLAVCGTINDLAMCGARPRWLSVALILEEGLPISILRQVLCDMRHAADDASVQLVTGDTKVVERGKADGLYITTSGVGEILSASPISPKSVRAGDAILLSGDLGRHGTAILSVREGLEFDPPPLSDCQALHAPILKLLAAGVELHCLRDCTRGGLTSALVEISRDSGFNLHLKETAIPISPAVSAACELLGLDPLQLACEGRFVAFVPESAASEALAILRACPESADAAIIGVVSIAKGRPSVDLETPYGVVRALDLPDGDPVPRIC